MMDVTLGQAGETLLWLAAIIAGILALYKLLKDAIKKILEEEFKSLRTDIGNLKKQVETNDAELSQKIDELSMGTCKNFITRYLSDVERGVLVGEIEKERFSEEWDYYTKHDGNSYIKSWYKKLEDKGFL